MLCCFFFFSFFFDAGMGKTALMAKLAHEVYQTQRESDIRRPVIIRFCGTSVGTINYIDNSVIRFNRI